MKSLLTLMILILSQNLFAAETLELICLSEGRQAVTARIEISSKENFEVDLTNEYGEAIPVTSKWVTFDEKGDLEGVTTSGGWENFKIEKSADNIWRGEYWYDNSLSVLECQTKNLTLLCTSQFGIEIPVEVIVRTKEDYEIKLGNFNAANWHVDREEVSFNDKGEVVKIEKAAFFENFSITKTDGVWSGLYAYDLGYYPLNCKDPMHLK